MVKRIRNIWNLLLILCHTAKRWRRHYPCTWENAVLIHTGKKKNHPSPWVGKKWEGRGGKKNANGNVPPFFPAPPPLGFWRLPRKIKLVYSTVLTRTMICTTTRLSIRSNRTKESAKNKKVRSASVRKTYWTITEFMYWDHLGGTISARDIPLTVTQCNFWFVSTNTRSC